MLLLSGCWAAAPAATAPTVEQPVPATAYTYIDGASVAAASAATFGLTAASVGLRGLSFEIVTLPAWISSSASWNDLKQFKLRTVCSGFSEQIKPFKLQLVGQAAEFDFESKFKSLPVI